MLIFLVQIVPVIIVYSDISTAYTLQQHNHTNDAQRQSDDASGHCISSSRKFKEIINLDELLREEGEREEERKVFKFEDVCEFGALLKDVCSLPFPLLNEAKNKIRHVIDHKDDDIVLLLPTSGTSGIFLHRRSYY